MHATRRHRPTSFLARVTEPLFTLSSTPSSGIPGPRCARRRRADVHEPIIAFLLLVTAVLGAQPSLAQQTRSEDAIEETVVVTGRGGGPGLREVMDTVSEVKEIKHAYRAGIRARQGVDY